MDLLDVTVFNPQAALAGAFVDTAIVIPKGKRLVLHPIGGSCDLAAAAGAGDAKLTIDANAYVSIGPSNGQTVYVSALAGVTVQYATD